MANDIKENIPNITTFIFDVDGVLTNGTVTLMENGEQIRQMNIKDGYALKTAVDEGMNVCVISGGSNEGVRKRLQGLGVTDIHLGTHQKTETLHAYFAEKSIQPENTLYMGDDIPDFKVMQEVGLPCCPQDAVPEIKEISKYVSHKKGGEGCVRDIIEQVLKVQGKWMSKHSGSAKYD